MRSLNESHDHSQTSDETKPTKKCTKCGELKSLSEFSKDIKKRDGKNIYCKKCGSERYKKFISSKEPLEYKIDRMYRSAKCRAKKKGMVFNIKKSDIQIPKVCPCLGVTLEVSGYIENGTTGGRPNSPSLDRIDSSKGYTPDNIWVVSYRANAIMSNATPMELKLIYTALDAKLSSIDREKQMELDL